MRDNGSDVKSLKLKDLYDIYKILVNYNLCFFSEEEKNILKFVSFKFLHDISVH